MLLFTGALWCLCAPAVKGMHSLWGLAALTLGSMMLHFRFDTRTSNSKRIRWAYMAVMVGLVVATMILKKPLAIWTSSALLLMSVLWPRFHTGLDRK